VNQSYHILYLVLVTYGTVFLAELIGDKTLYTISSLSARFHPRPVFCGVSIAFMGKTLAAVALGRFISELPPGAVSGMSAVTFFITATVIWFKKTENQPTEGGRVQVSWMKAVAIAFATIFFSEWADIGQLTTAALAARYQAPVVVWCSATLALMTKGALAIALGIGLRKWIPMHVLRPIAASVCVLMGVVSARGLLPWH
jgi:putative Ca2+/H+ antiporter (TMEM165/GDT1 family)